LEEKLAALAKILKTHKVDKILGYRQLPPDRENRILFGWEEKNELPTGKELIVCRPAKKKKGEVNISTKDDYVSYFSAIAGVAPTQFLGDLDSLEGEIKSLKLEVDFAKSMAILLTEGTPFSWGDKEFLMIEDKIS